MSEKPIVYLVAGVFSVLYACVFFGLQWISPEQTHWFALALAAFAATVFVSAFLLCLVALLGAGPLIRREHERKERSPGPPPHISMRGGVIVRQMNTLPSADWLLKEDKS